MQIEPAGLTALADLPCSADLPDSADFVDLSDSAGFVVLADLPCSADFAGSFDRSSLFDYCGIAGLLSVIRLISLLCRFCISLLYYRFCLFGLTASGLSSDHRFFLYRLGRFAAYLCLLVKYFVYKLVL